MANNPIFLQSDCRKIKKELSRVERKYNNFKTPNERLLQLYIWEKTYQKWEECNNYNIDIELDDRASLFKKELKTAIQNPCTYCISLLDHSNDNRTLMDQLIKCKCPLTHTIIEDLQFEICEEGTIQDCHDFKTNYPNSNKLNQVEALLYQKNEYNDYTFAINGSLDQYNLYLNKYPNGEWYQEINALKKRYLEKQNRLEISHWQQGDRVCNEENPEGTIEAVVEEWNQDRSRYKVKLLGGYKGSYKGEDIFKGNQIWIATDGWYQCIGDEKVNYALLRESELAEGKYDYRYAIGDQVKCRQWGSNSGYNGVIMGRKDGKYMVKVTHVIVKGLFKTILASCECTGFVDLCMYQDLSCKEGEGSLILVSQQCLD